MRHSALELLLILVLGLWSTCSAATDQVTYKFSGTTDYGKDFTLTYTYDLAAAPDWGGPDYASWRPDACDFTVDSVSYVGTPGAGSYIQDNGQHGNGQPFSVLHCEAPSGHLELQLEKTSGFANVAVAERLDVPVVLRGGYVNGQQPISVALATSGLTTYEAVGKTDRGKRFRLAFTIDPDGPPIQTTPDFARWRPVTCSFTVDGVSYYGDPMVSELVQDGTQPGAGRHHLMCNAGGAAPGSAFFVILKPGGFPAASVLEPLALPADLEHGNLLGEMVEAATINLRAAGAAASYQLTGSTNAGEPFSVRFRYSLTDLPDDIFGDDFAFWRMPDCAITIGGATYDGDPTYSRYEQDDAGRMTRLMCDDGNGRHAFFEIGKPGGFSAIDVVERLHLPAQVMHGWINGNSAIQTLVTDLDAIGSIRTYDVLGKTDQGKRFRLAFTVDLDDLPLETTPDFARWRPLTCSFTLDGVSYYGDPMVSQLVQDGTQPGDGRHHLMCNAGSAMPGSAFIVIVKPGGFADASVLEPLALPADLEHGNLLGEMVAAAAISQRSADATANYRLEGTTSTDEPFSVRFTYALTGLPEQNFGTDFAMWPMKDCAITIGGTSYGGDPMYSRYEQDNAGRMTRLMCDDGSGHHAFFEIAKPDGFSAVDLVERLHVPAQVMHGWIDTAAAARTSLIDIDLIRPILTYEARGRTDQGKDVRLAFTVALDDPPIEPTSGFARWRPLACDFTIDGVSYYGDPANSELMQEGFQPGEGRHHLHCGTGGPTYESIFIALTKPGGFADVSVMERLALPADLEHGDALGQFIPALDIIQRGANAEASYRFSGTTNLGEPFAVMFSYGLTDVDGLVEVPMDTAGGDHAHWFSRGCTMTIGGQTRSGDPHFSQYHQDNPGAAALLSCDDGLGQSAFFELDQPGGFSAVALPQRLHLPASPRYALVGSGAPTETFVTELDPLREPVSYEIVGLTDAGNDFRMGYTVDRLAVPFESTTNRAAWRPVGCYFIVDDIRYQGDLTRSEFAQDVSDAPTQELLCVADAGGTEVRIHVARPSGFADLALMQALELPGFADRGSVLGEQIMPGSVVIDEVLSQQPRVVIELTPSGAVGAGVGEGDALHARLLELTGPYPPGSYTLEWALGTGEVMVGVTEFDLAYPDEGNYTLTLTATDPSGVSGSASVQTTVTNVAPAVDAGTDFSTDMLVAVGFSGQFSDPGVFDSHTAVWDFGDGTTAHGLVATHAYQGPGSYVATLSVADDDGAIGIDTRTITVAPVFGLDVTPLGPVALSGPVGGPFAPACADFALTNTSTIDVHWNAQSSAAWLTVDASAGMLAPGVSQSLHLCPTGAHSLPAGTHAGTLTIAEAESGLSHTRDLDLRIGPAGGGVSVGYDFSDALPAAGWTYYSSAPGNGRIQQVAGRMRMDVVSNGAYNLNEAVLKVDLSHAIQVGLSFYQSRNGDELHPLPEQFLGHFNGDGVAVSDDGVTWYRAIASELLSAVAQGRTFAIDLDSVIASIRQNYDSAFGYSSQFLIKFQQYDNYAFATDGREWDDIQLDWVRPDLAVDPAQPLVVELPEEAIGTVDCQSYALTNQADGVLDWTAASNDAWLQPSLSAGTLAVGQSVAIDLCWDTAGMAAGMTFAGTVDFVALPGGATQTRSVRVHILGNGRPPYLQDFTDGLPGAEAGFTYYSSDPSRGRIAVANGRLRMDVDQSGSYSLNEAVLTLDLSDLSGVHLGFFHAESSDENHAVPATFSGHADGDAVAVSNDGITWYRVLDAADLDVGAGGRAIDVDLDAEVARIRANYDATFDYGPAFRIKFQQYDNYAFPTDGREWAAISVIAD